MFSGFPACTSKVSAPGGDDAEHTYRVRLGFEPARGGARLRRATVIEAPDGATGLRALERCLVDTHGGIVFSIDRREAILVFSTVPAQAPADGADEIDRDLLEALPVEVGFARGPDDAAVTIVVYTDFQCPYCTRALATMDELLEEYPRDLRVVTKLFPLKPSSRRLAEATVAAAEQGNFWPMHDLIFAHQDAAGLTDDDLRGFAERIGLDVPAFMRALDSDDVAALVQADIDEGHALGVRGTPTMLVEGERVVGAQPIDVFRELIDAHLASGGNR